MSALAELATGPLGLVLRATLVLAAALLLDRSLRSVAALSRHVLWVVTVFALLALPVLQLELPRLAIPGWYAATGVAQVGATPEPTVLTLTPADPAPTNTVAALPPLGGEPSVNVRGGNAPMPWTVAIGLLWLVGATLLIVALVRSVRRARRVVQDAIPVLNRRLLARLEHARRLVGVRRSVALLVSEEIRTPMAGGVRRAVILLPIDAADWSADRLDAVLCHELIHVRRFDAVNQLASRLAVACYWFHPLAWQGARRAAAAREEACDEAVLALGARPSHYARHLVDLAEHGMSLPSMPALALLHHPNLEDRVMAILRFSPAPASPRRTLVAVATLLGWTAVIAAASPAEAQRPVRPPQPPVAPAAVEMSAPIAPVPFEPGAEIAFPVASAPNAPGAPEVPAASLARPMAPPPAPLPADCVAERSVASDGAARGSTQSVTGIQIERLRGGGSACLAVWGTLSQDFQLSPLGRLPNGVTMILAAEVGDKTQRLEIQGTASGNRNVWSVNGVSRRFDADATEWRDAMLALLAPRWQRSQDRTAQVRVTKPSENAWTVGGADAARAVATQRVVELAARQHELATRQHELAAVQIALADRAHERAAREQRAVAQVVLVDRAHEVATRHSMIEAKLAEAHARTIAADSVMVRLAPTMARLDSVTGRLQAARELDRRARGDAEAMAVDAARLERMVDTLRTRTALARERFVELRAHAIELRAAGVADRAVALERPVVVVEQQAGNRAAEARLRAAIEKIGPQ